MLTGAYSSIFVATPLLGVLKGRHGGIGEHLVGEDLRSVVVRGVGIARPGDRSPPSAAAPQSPVAGDRSPSGRRAARSGDARGARAEPPSSCSAARRARARRSATDAERRARQSPSAWPIGLSGLAVAGIVAA